MLADGVLPLTATIEMVWQVRRTGEFPVTTFALHLHNGAGADAIRTHETIPVVWPNPSREIRVPRSPPRAGIFELGMMGWAAAARSRLADVNTVGVSQCPALFWGSILQL